MWGAKIDLKHAYFHLGLAETFNTYVCINLEEKIYQFQTACFILVVGSSQIAVKKSLETMLKDLKDAGLVVNWEKSHTTPTHKIEHLGFEIDFSQGVLLIPSEKVKFIRKQLGKLLTV